MTATDPPDLQPDWLVACAECGATPGGKCLTLGGKPMKHGHLLRLFQNELQLLKIADENTQISHVYCCACGAETKVEPCALEVGSVVQCPICKEVRARVTPAGGGQAWITVSPAEVEFYNLL